MCFSTSPRSLPRRATPELGWNVIAALGQAINLDVEKLLWQRASDICDFHATRILTERDGMGCRRDPPLARHGSSFPARVRRRALRLHPARLLPPPQGADLEAAAKSFVQDVQNTERSLAMPPIDPHTGRPPAWYTEVVSGARGALGLSTAPPPHNGFFRAWQAQGKGGQGGLERGRGGRGRRGPGGAGPSRHAGRGRWAPAATRSGIGGNGTTS